MASLYSRFGSVPVTAAILREALPEHKAGAMRLALLRRRGELVPLRRDLYLCCDPETGLRFTPGIIANHLLAPSYVSFETALAAADAIPERVSEVKSATTKRRASYTNETGFYTYRHFPAAYFSLGQEMHRADDGPCCLMAMPEKALCDLIIATPGLRLQSARALRRYLEEDLRLAPGALRSERAAMVHRAAEVASAKRTDLELLATLLEHDDI